MAPPKAPRASGLLLEEEEFPRGGGTGLDPIAEKRLRKEAFEEALSEYERSQDSKRRRKGDRKSVDVDADAAVASGKRRGSSASPAAHVSGPRAESLRPGLIVAGASVWGVVFEATSERVGVVLAGGVRGWATASEALGPGWKEAGTTPAEAYRLGQFVRARVLSAASKGSADADGKGGFSSSSGQAGAAGSTSGASQSSMGRVSLSLVPRTLHRGWTRRSFPEGACVTASVTSVEDHGYLLDLGSPAAPRAFLPRADLRNSPAAGAAALPVGAVLEVVLLRVPRGSTAKNAKSSAASAAAPAQATAAPGVVAAAPLDVKASDASLSTLLAGSLVEGTVKAVTHDGGVVVTFGGVFQGTVDWTHLGEADPLAEDEEKEDEEGEKKKQGGEEEEQEQEEEEEEEESEGEEAGDGPKKSQRSGSKNQTKSQQGTAKDRSASSSSSSSAKPSSLRPAVRIGQRVRARILFVDPASKRIFLTLRRALLDEETVHVALPPGVLLTDATVLRADARGALVAPAGAKGLAELSKSVAAALDRGADGGDETGAKLPAAVLSALCRARVFVPTSALPKGGDQNRKDAKKSNKGTKNAASSSSSSSPSPPPPPPPRGSTLTVRVVGDRPLEGLAVASADAGVLASPALEVGALDAGRRVAGTVVETSAKGVVVQLAPGVKGTVPLLHVADGPGATLEAPAVAKALKRLAPGARVEARVLRPRDALRRTPLLTLKPSLVRSRLPPLVPGVAPEPGRRAHGVVTGVAPGRAFVELFGGLSGVVRAKDAGVVVPKAGERGSDKSKEAHPTTGGLLDVLKVGQVVKVRVLGADPAGRGLRLGLGSGKADAAAQEDAEAQRARVLPPGALCDARVFSVIRETPAAAEETEGAEASGASSSSSLEGDDDDDDDAPAPVRHLIVDLFPAGSLAGGSSSSSVPQPSSLGRARIPPSHLSDSPAACEALSEAAHVGLALGRVAVLRPATREGGLALVTRKRALVEACAAGSLPSELDQLAEGSVLPGYVASVTPDAAFVRFLGGLTARAGLGALADAHVSDAREVFAVGRTVRALVGGVDREAGRARVSLRPSLFQPDGALLEERFRGLSEARLWQALAEELAAQMAADEGKEEEDADEEDAEMATAETDAEKKEKEKSAKVADEGDAAAAPSSALSAPCPPLSSLLSASSCCALPSSLISPPLLGSALQATLGERRPYGRLVDLGVASDLVALLSGPHGAPAEKEKDGEAVQAVLLDVAEADGVADASLLPDLVRAALGGQDDERKEAEPEPEEESKKSKGGKKKVAAKTRSTSTSTSSLSALPKGARCTVRLELLKPDDGYAVVSVLATHPEGATLAAAVPAPQTSLPPASPLRVGYLSLASLNGPSALLSPAAGAALEIGAVFHAECLGEAAPAHPRAACPRVLFAAAADLDAHAAATGRRARRGGAENAALADGSGRRQGRAAPLPLVRPAVVLRRGPTASLVRVLDGRDGAEGAEGSSAKDAGVLALLPALEETESGLKELETAANDAGRLAPGKPSALGAPADRAAEGDAISVVLLSKKSTSSSSSSNAPFSSAHPDPATLDPADPADLAKLLASPHLPTCSRLPSRLAAAGRGERPGAAPSARDEWISLAEGLKAFAKQARKLSGSATDAQKKETKGNKASASAVPPSPPVFPSGPLVRCVVERVGEEDVVLSLGRHASGVAFRGRVSSSPRQAASLASLPEWQPGTVHVLRLVRADASTKRAELEAPQRQQQGRPDGSAVGADASSAPASPAAPSARSVAGEVAVGRVVAAGGSGVVVRLSPSEVGTAPLCELRDSPVADALEGFAPGQWLRARVLVDAAAAAAAGESGRLAREKARAHVRPAAGCLLSLRPALGGEAPAEAKARQAPEAERSGSVLIEHGGFDDLDGAKESTAVPDLVHGYVCGGSQHGLLVSISATSFGFLPADRVAMDYVPDLLAAHPVGTLLCARALAHDQGKSEGKGKGKGKGKGLSSAQTLLPLTRVGAAAKARALEAAKAARAAGGKRRTKLEAASADAMLGLAARGVVRKATGHGVLIALDPLEVTVDGKATQLANLLGYARKNQIYDDADAAAEAALERAFPTGARVRVRVLAADPETNRIDLGLKPSYFAGDLEEPEEDDDADQGGNAKGIAAMDDDGAEEDIEAELGADEDDDQGEEGTDVATRAVQAGKRSADEPLSQSAAARKKRRQRENRRARETGKQHLDLDAILAASDDE